MPIENLQRQAHEVGRIRLGDKGAKGAPRKLDCFRLTTQNRAILECAASLYGGEVRPWEGHLGFFELYTTAKELPFLASPVELSQWYELWKAGGCERRCDGVREWIKDTRCLCDPENRECKMHTRFSVFLYELPGLGVWRLETSGFYAATELPAEAQWLIESAKRGKPIKATLSIEHRQKKSPGEVTKNYIVPVIHTPLSIGQILLGAEEQKTISPTDQKQIAAKPEEKQTFRSFMVADTKKTFEMANIEPTVANMAEACFVDESVSAKWFKDGKLVWVRLSNEQLLQATCFAESGKRIGDEQAIKDTLEALKHQWENPTSESEEQDIGEEEL